jgi:hypothetical protein
MAEEITRKESIQIQIRRIKQLSFFVDEAWAGMIPQSTIQFDFKSGFNFDNKFIDCIIKIMYSNPATGQKFIQTEVQTIYGIPNIDKFLDENKSPDLPTIALLFIVGSLIAHARALLATSLAGTAYSDMLLPIVDTVAVAKQFFGDKIKDAEINHDVQVISAELATPQ